MVTLLLLLVTVLVAVAAAEFVRTTCRRQLMAPAVVRRPTEQTPR